MNGNQAQVLQVRDSYRQIMSLKNQRGLSTLKDKPKEQKDWGNKQEGLDLKNVKTLNIPKEAFAYGQMVLSARLTQKNVTKSKDLASIGVQLDTLPGVTKVYGIDTVVKGATLSINYGVQEGFPDELPSLSHLTNSVLYAIYGSAYLQSTLSPKMLMADLEEVLGQEKHRDRIERSLLTLFGMTIAYNNNKKGKKNIRYLARPISSILFEGIGKGSTVEVGIGEHYAKGLKELGEKGSQYIKIPKKALLPSKYNQYQQSYLNYLYGIKGHRKSYTPYVKTILIEQAGYSEKVLKKMTSRGIRELVYSVCDVAKDEGLLSDYVLNTATDSTLKKWRLWKMRISLP